MKEERYFYVPNAKECNELPEEEAQHAVRVLRLKEGDRIYLMDGCGTFHEAEITLASHKRCMYDIIAEMPQERLWKGRIHIAMAPTKMMERTEWMAEKVTEIGVDEISFIESQFSERRKIRIDRVEKIVLSAMKQSRKAWKTKVNEMQKFEDFINNNTSGKRYICHCHDEIERVDLFSELVKAKDAEQESIILIGPEGDFSIEEVKLAMEKGYIPVSLGKSRLRTETAAISAVMMAQLSLR